MSFALRLLDLDGLESANPPENQMLEHLRQQLTLNNADYDSTTSPTSTSPSASASGSRRPRARAFRSRTRSNTPSKEARRLIPNFFNLPQDNHIRVNLMLVAEKISQPPIGTRTSFIYKNNFMKSSKKIVNSTQRRPPTPTRPTSTAQTPTMRVSENDLLNLLQDSITRRKTVFSLNSTKIKTPLTDALKEGMKLIEDFERGKMAKRNFMKDWLIMNELIQNAMREEQDESNLFSMLTLNDTLKQALREDQKAAHKTETTTEMSLVIKLRQNRHDKHFMAYRFRPTTKGRTRQTTKTFKIFAAYNKSNKSATKEEKKTHIEHETTAMIPLQAEVDSDDGESERSSEEKVFRQAHAYQPEETTETILTTIKTENFNGFRISNVTQDTMDFSSKEDVPWKKETLIKRETDGKKYTSTPMMQVHWVTHQQKVIQMTMLMEDLPEGEHNRQVVQDKNTARKDNGKTSQEQEYEEVLQNFNILRQMNQEKDVTREEHSLQNEEGPENVQVDILLSKDDVKRAIGSSFVRKLQIESQKEIEDNPQEELIEEYPELFVVKKPVKEFYERSLSIEDDKTLQSNETISMSDSVFDLQQLPERRALYKEKKQKPGKKEKIKRDKPKKAPQHVIETSKNTPRRTEDNLRDWDEALTAAVRRTAARSARLGAGGRRQKRARNASAASKLNRTAHKRMLQKRVAFKY